MVSISVVVGGIGVGSSGDDGLHGGVVVATVVAIGVADGLGGDFSGIGDGGEECSSKSEFHGEFDLI